MSVNVHVYKIRFIDSLSFIPMALAEMPDAFGETELATGYFSDLLNCKDNQNAILQHLPDFQYYTTDSMKTRSS